jgi:hypothetical protein
MRSFFLSCAIFVNLIGQSGCHSKQDAMSKRTLVPAVVDKPEIVQEVTAGTLFVGVDDSHFFFYRGDSSDCKKLKGLSFDSLIVSHKNNYSTAAFVIVNCPTSSYSNMDSLLLRLKKLGVEKFTLDNKRVCCSPD